MPERLYDASGLNMILADHGELVQSANGLENARIVAIIDHHGDGTVTTGEQLIYDARPLGSTSTIIWIRYRNYGVVPDRQNALLMTGAILSDTADLKSGSSTFADAEALKALCALAGGDDPHALYAQMYKASISYRGKTDEEIFYSDYKEYDAGATRYAVGCVNAYDEDSARDIAQRMKALFPSVRANTGIDIAYAQISIFHDDISITYIVPSGGAARAAVEAAFGERAVFDGTSFVLKPGVSRRKELVPALSAVMESFPKE